MTLAVSGGAVSGQSAPGASRIAVALVHFFVLVLFLQNVQVTTWPAVLGFLVIHLYSGILLYSWSRLERSAAGDTTIVVPRPLRLANRAGTW